MGLLYLFAPNSVAVTNELNETMNREVVLITILHTYCTELTGEILHENL
jgi:hypothetical protein